MFRKYFDVGAHVLHVFHAGRSTLPGVPPDLTRGRTVLFLHGAGSNGSVWHRQIEQLAAGESPLAFDFPGHGRSTGTEALPSIGEYAEVTVDLLDRLGVERAVLVGTSMGGGVAIDAALRAPERVAALVLVSTTACFSLSDESIDRWRRVMLGREPQPFTADGYGDDVPPEVLREGWEQQVKTDPRVRYFDLLACRAMDYRARLGDLRVPALVVCGTRDTVAPPEASEELATAISGARLETIEGGGHFLYRERPEALGAAIQRFLAAGAAG
ncbi:MAG: hypothetical protein QOD06_2012 [Candidatus Binatota bacterium]|jgi:pimeloyl-ACP methyl ester carboxylesterase|nr:hypothetical protein [Candidatus Binatota bacterium]